MQIITRHKAEKIASLLLQMQDALDETTSVDRIYGRMIAAMRDIAKTAGIETEYSYAMGITRRKFDGT